MNVTLLGAGGKMGLRLSRNLKDSEYTLRCVEISERGKAALAAADLAVSTAEESVPEAEAVILAVPDNRIGSVASQIAPLCRPGAMLVVLDAAAPYAGDMPARDDLSYFVAHPCHPPVFSEETTPEAQRDFFGGEHARQHIVCALMQGPESDYAKGEQLARAFYAPVMKAHRVTIEQMAILEPVLSETMLATCLTVMREALDEAVLRGVPREAARDFLLGHMRVEAAICFEEKEGAVFSDGAIKAVEDAKSKLFRPDWKKVFDKDELDTSIARITKTE